MPRCAWQPVLSHCNDSYMPCLLAPPQVQPEAQQLSLLHLRMDVLEDRLRLRSPSIAQGQQAGSSGGMGQGIRPAAEPLGAAAVSFNGELQVWQGGPAFGFDKPACNSACSPGLVCHAVAVAGWLSVLR